MVSAQVAIVIPLTTINKWEVIVTESKYKEYNN